MLEDGLNVSLSGLHPDDDLNVLFQDTIVSAGGAELGSFHQWVDRTAEKFDSLDAVELVMALEEAAFRRRSAR